MKFELFVIENALEYYQINDTNYKNKCYKCIKDVNEITGKYQLWRLD